MASNIFLRAFGAVAMKIRFLGFVTSAAFKGTFISLSVKMTFYGNIEIGKNCRIANGCVFHVPKGAKLKIADGTDFREYSQVICRSGFVTEFGKNCLIEPFCFISDSVKLGNDVILAPHCVLAAARHNFSDLSKPINKQGSKTLPIEIGNNAWLGAHVVVIGPSKIGSDSIIGAGAIIKGEIPEKSIVRTEPKMNIEKRRSLAK